MIKTAGKPLEKCLVKTDPFEGNQCSDTSCLPANYPNNRISSRRNNVGYKIRCKLCLLAGGSNGGIFIGETGENMHVRMKSHNSKKEDTR